MTSTRRPKPVAIGNTGEYWVRRTAAGYSFKPLGAWRYSRPFPTETARDLAMMDHWRQTCNG